MDKKRYLTETVIALLEGLHSDARPSFGVMTPQHMVEHLIWVTKSSVKDFGPPRAELSEGQQKFMKFLEKGSPFRYIPKEDAMDRLQPLRMSNLAEAINEIPSAINRIYAFDEDHQFYNPMMGVYSFDQLETFHVQHFRHHLEAQYGLTDV